MLTLDFGGTNNIYLNCTLIFRSTINKRKEENDQLEEDIKAAAKVQLGVLLNLHISIQERNIRCNLNDGEVR